VIEAFGERFKVVPEGRSYVIKLSFTSEDPEKAARVANSAAELYVDALRAEKVGKTERSTRWLADRLDVLREEVEAADEAVERYRIKHDVTEAQGVSLNEARLFELNQKLSGLRGDHAAQMAKVTRIKAMRGKSLASLEAVPEVLASMTIINLREREAGLLREESELRSVYGTRHPRIQTLQEEKAALRGKVQAEVDRIIETIENEGDTAAERIRTLEAEIAQVKQGTTLDREAAVDLRQLEREAETSKSLYTMFLQRYKETEEQSVLLEADAKVVSTAAPPADPSTPGPVLFGAVGFTASMMLGTLLALLLERLDSGIRSAKQVEALLGLPTLGLVPRLERLPRQQKPHHYLLAKPLSAYAESVRALYTSLQLADVDHPPRVVLVTSALPQEGKSTLALSLATFAANHAGRRALLVDVDLRHPSVHRDLGAQPEQGLVEHLAGERALDEVIAFDAVSNLHYLPVHRQTGNPTDLLGSERMKQLFAALRERFDFIVLDAAPLIGVTDSKVAAMAADRVLFALRWDQTTKDTAANALAQLREVKTPVAGVVLTLVDVKKHAQYGYGDVGQYYGKYHKYYVN
jgi:capsular exopolysaccharide synthesis family protein